MKIIFFTVLLVFCTQIFAQEKDYGPTKAKDSLWNISSAYKTEGMTMYQLMLAFFNKNPNSFYQGNMNRLKQGVYLKIPNQTEVDLIDFKTATIIVDHKVKEYDVFYKKFSTKQELPEIISPPKEKKSSVKKSIDIGTVANNQPDINDRFLINKVDIKKVKRTLKKEVLEAKTKQIDPSTLFNYGKPLKATYSYDLSISFDDNLRLAQYAEDIRDDFISTAIIKVGTSIKVSRLSRFNIGASLELENYSTFDTLNNVKYSITSRYSFATTSGFSAPLYAIKLSIGGIESNLNMRSSNVHSIGLDMNKRLTSQMHLTTGLQYKKRESQSDVFDTNKKLIFANLDYVLSRKSLFYGTYHFIKGDSVSSATPTLEIINVSDSIEPDDAFGGVLLNQFAYKVRTTTHVATIGFNYRSSRKLSFDISARYVSSESDDDSNIYYDRTIIRAGILGKF